MSYEFQSVLHNPSFAAHLACAGEWLSAGGMYGQSEILDALKENSDAELARECNEGWGMDNPAAGSAADWFDIGELEAAFAVIRENPAEEFGWE